MPDWRGTIRQRLAALDLDPTSEADIIEELAAHLDDRFQELTDRGVPAQLAEATVLAEGLADEALTKALAGARATARRIVPLGGGDVDRAARFSGLTADARYAVRALRKRPSLTIVALLTLTIGIGVNAAIFSVVNALLLRPLPFDEPNQLVTFWGTAPEKGLPVVNYPDVLYAYYRQRLRTVQPMAMYSGGDFTLVGRGEPERLKGATPTIDFFNVLGVAPLLGRTFLEEEHIPGRNLVTILSYAFWQRRFAGDSTIVGQALNLNNIPTTVVGVMRPGFEFPGRTELWIPLGIDPQSMNCWCYSAIGRLTPGNTPESLAREIDRTNADFWAEREGRQRPTPQDTARSGTVVRPLARDLVGDVRAPVLLLFGAAAMVLLIACANLANLLLAGTTDRRREIAVRCSLGASPRRIVRQLLVESLLLSFGGAIVGLALGAAALRAATPFLLERLPHIDQIGLDPVMLLFTAGVAIATGLLFGAVPAIKGAGIQLAPALKEGMRGTGDRSHRRLNDAFVVAQIALSLMLLVGAGLLLRSFSNLQSVDRGFRAENVIVGRVSLPWTVYDTLPKTFAFATRLEDGLRTVPGVRAVGISSTAPFSRNNNQQEVVVQGKEPAANEPVPVASVRRVSATYFDAIGTPLVSGRPFNASDRDGGQLVAIIDESLAKRYWPDGNAIGGMVAVGSRSDPTWRTIVGVVATIRHQQLDRPPDHYVYGPLSQNPALTLDVIVRSPLATAELTAALRRATQALDASVPVYDVRTLSESIDESLATRRMTNALMACFAAAALLLAAVGIFGVMARNVAARVKEFGVRLALGASPQAVVALVVRRGATLVILGLVLGVAGAIGLTGFLRTLLFGVTPRDLATYVAAPLLLAIVALVACWLPARRATSADPLDALRAE